MAKSPHKTSAQRPRFNINKQPKADGTFDVQKQFEYAMTRRQEILASKKVNWAKLREVIMNR